MKKAVKEATIKENRKGIFIERNARKAGWMRVGGSDLNYLNLINLDK